MIFKELCEQSQINIHYGRIHRLFREEGRNTLRVNDFLLVSMVELKILVVFAQENQGAYMYITRP